MPPSTSTRPSCARQRSRAAARIASNERPSGASASRLRRAPAASTNEIPARIVIVRCVVVSKVSEKSSAVLIGALKRATKWTG